MARYLWQSLVETIAPDVEQPAQNSSKPLSHSIGGEPLAGEGERGTNLGLVSKAALEQSEDPIMAQPRGSRKIAVDGVEIDSDDLGEIVIMPPQDLASQIAVWKTTTAPEYNQKDPTNPEVSHDMEVEDPEDMLHDAKLYQDAAIEYCNAYQALERKYSEQAWLMEEASGALTAAEFQTSQKQQQLKKKHDADVQLAVSKTTVQYEEQLSSVTQQLQAKDQAMEKLKEQVCALEISLASQTNLPLVAPTKEEVDLHREVFDFLPGTVNTKRDAATYKSRDQPFHFEKQV